MAVLDIRFLGIAEINVNGIAVHLERRNSLALLAYLLLTSRPHSRDELATLLAGDIGDDPARKRLRNALADLVEHGLGDFLLTSRQTVAFNAALPYTLDIDTLDDLITAGDSVPPEGLAWAAERCDWELLSGLAPRDAPAFELWLLNERERRGRQIRDLAQRHLRMLRESGQHEAGITLAQRLLAVEPWNESVHRDLMRLHAQTGQIAMALAQYQRCRDALAEELGTEPHAETTTLAERLRAGPVTIRHNLPATIDASEMIGRDEQLESVTTSLVDPACRLLTIVGLGGSGKTSLALAAARRLSTPAPIGEDHPFGDGIVLVNMAETPEADVRSGSDESTERRIATAIGFALGIVFYGHIDRLEQVIAYLHPKRMLLVLDNMEHLRSGAPVLLAILRRCPGVTILATSRYALDIANEWTHELGGLPSPESVDELERAPASQLFLREARRANAHINGDDEPDIVQICRLTGGWPLAIKIAAGWLGPLTCAEIVRELKSGGNLLNQPLLRVGDRSDSIRSIVAATYEVLPARDRQALTRLAVFSGPFHRQAAEAVGVTTPSLVALNQRSLLERLDRDSYTLHPLVGTFASEQLSNRRADETAARSDHASFYATIVEASSPALFTNPEAHAVIGSDRANVQAAWDWAVDQQDVDLIEQLLEGLATWNQQAGLHREWTASLTAAISRLRTNGNDPDRSEILAQLLVAKAESLLWQGDLDSAFPLLEEARQYAGQTGTLKLESLISFCEGHLLRFRGGQHDAAIELLQQARVLARATQQHRIEANSLLQLAFAATDNENYQEAESFLHRAVEAFQMLGDRLSLARTTSHQGRLSVYRGDYIRARVDLEQSLHIARLFGDRFTEAYAQLFLGIISDVAFGRHQEADEQFEQALAVAVQTGDPYLDGNVHRAIGQNAMHAGDFARAEQSLNHAVQRARDVGNARALNESLRLLAQFANAIGDYSTAEDRAQQALHLSTELRRRSATAATLLCLGQARERQGHLSNASAAYTEAFNLVASLGIPHLRCDVTTGLASVSLAAGDIAFAVRYVEEVLPHLFTQSLAGCEEPGWVIETCSRVLQAAGDRRADEVLQHGAELLERRAVALPEPARDRYVSASKERGIVLRHWQSRVETQTTPVVLRLPLDGPPDIEEAGDSATDTPEPPNRHQTHLTGQPYSPHWPARARRRHRPKTPKQTPPA